MSVKPHKKKPAKNNSLVPVLFTLGVIGWGFFAIDRLTSSTNPGYADFTAEARNYVHETGDNGKSWKKTTEDFVKKFTTAPKIKDDPETENWTIVKDEEQKTPLNENNFEVESNNKINGSHTYYLYFYKEIGDQFKLSQFSRKTQGDIALKNIFRELVGGPGFLHQGKNIVDSFPLKPTIIDAHIKQNTLFLNIDDNFGHGISFETARLQLEQIVKTSSQFKNVSAVQFLINGEEVESLQIDGLTIPANIKTNVPLALSRNSEN